MKRTILKHCSILVLALLSFPGQSQPSPDEITFVRQGVRRFIFDEKQQIPLSLLNPGEIIGMSAMYPTRHFGR